MSKQQKVKSKKWKPQKVEKIKVKLQKVKKKSQKQKDKSQKVKRDKSQMTESQKVKLSARHVETKSNEINARIPMLKSISGADTAWSYIVPPPPPPAKARTAQAAQLDFEHDCQVFDKAAIKPKCWLRVVWEILRHQSPVSQPF